MVSSRGIVFLRFMCTFVLGLHAEICTKEICEYDFDVRESRSMMYTMEDPTGMVERILYSINSTTWFVYSLGLSNTARLGFL